MTLEFTPRPAQERILSYREGTMGVSAVPGSGKTWTLSLLAAELIHNGLVTPDQEILIVTLVNSAVANFSTRISSFLKAYNLIPSLGYRVRTLHGLAHDIVKERPDLAGLDTNFSIIDDTESQRIRIDIIHNWIRNNPELLRPFIAPDINDDQLDTLFHKDIPRILDQVALQFIKTVKNHAYSISSISEKWDNWEQSFPLADFSLNVYDLYQRNLEYRGAVDFDDLIFHAYRILNLDLSLLNRLRQQWPYILEDEAQDSSFIQQQILTLLSSDTGNWVRVGDPNQAIYESFTTADPRLLISFSESADYNYLLPNSGRSTKEIIDLANYLVNWTTEFHPDPSIRSALIANYIEPTPPGDTQPNPPNKSGSIHLHDKPFSPDEELSIIAGSVAKWLENHPDETVAILAPRNERGKKISSKLRSIYNIDPVELLNSTLATRKTTGALVRILTCLLDPVSSKKLSNAYKVYFRELRSTPEKWNQIEREAKLIENIQEIERYISPGPDKDWLSTLSDQDDEVISRLLDFSRFVNRWQNAFMLPFDQLILTIANDIFDSPDELSLAQKMSVFIKSLSTAHPDWDKPVLVDELKSLARNERKAFFVGENTDFDPDSHKGQVVVTTAHKSKGLEWDRVYLMSVNNYNFPSGSDADKYIFEKWFIRNQLNLPAEALSQLKTVLSNGNESYIEGEASQKAREEYIRERLRLLYVAITRAKKDLIITWNTGRFNSLKPALAFTALLDSLNKNGEHDG